MPYAQGSRLGEISRDVAEEEVRDGMASIIQRGNEECQDYWDALLGHELAGRRADATLRLSSLISHKESMGR